LPNSKPKLLFKKEMSRGGVLQTFTKQLDICDVKKSIQKNAVCYKVMLLSESSVWGCSHNIWYLLISMYCKVRLSLNSYLKMDMSNYEWSIV
jgi:hypothetical protein